MAVGDELSIYVELKRQGRTSMTLEAHAIARERDGRRNLKWRPANSRSSRSTKTTSRGKSRCLAPLPVREREGSRGATEGRGVPATISATRAKAMRLPRPTEAEHRLWSDRPSTSHLRGSSSGGSVPIGPLHRRLSSAPQRRLIVEARRRPACGKRMSDARRDAYLARRKGFADPAHSGTTSVLHKRRGCRGSNTCNALQPLTLLSRG